MELTYETLLERIGNDPMKHLGGHSPRLIYMYFTGYHQARNLHSLPEIGGRLTMGDFNQWFIKNAWAGPQGWPSYCEMLTETEEEALRLFFEFRKLATKPVASAADDETGIVTRATPEGKLSMFGPITSDAIRKRPAMYLGNSNWASGIWSMWNGYVIAEQDIGIVDSPDAVQFKEFQEWLWKRYPLGEKTHWGKLFQFLGMDFNADVLEQFYDHFDLFLEGSTADANTKRFQEFLDGAVAAVLEDQIHK